MEPELIALLERAAEHRPECRPREPYRRLAFYTHSNAWGWQHEHHRHSFALMDDSTAELLWLGSMVRCLPIGWTLDHAGTDHWVVYDDVDGTCVMDDCATPIEALAAAVLACPKQGETK